MVHTGGTVGGAKQVTGVAAGVIEPAWYGVVMYVTSRCASGSLGVIIVCAWGTDEETGSRGVGGGLGVTSPLCVDLRDVEVEFVVVADDIRASFFDFISFSRFSAAGGRR